MKKINIAYIIENDEDLFNLSFQSIMKIAQEVIIVDGRQNQTIKNDFENIPNVKVIYSKYPHQDKGADGKQRNVYLEYLKKNHLGEWCLVLDADEVLDNQEQLLKFLNYQIAHADCYSVKMRHLVGSLGAEDSTVKEHFVPCRLFKVSEKLSYPENEHPVLQGFETHDRLSAITIWHFGYSREVFTLLRKYKNHCEKSTTHSKDFLTWWYHAHLFGKFPTTPVDYNELPEIILNHFLINKDYLYFENRGLELKHAELVLQWNKFFKPSTVLDIGCGFGQFLRYWEQFTLDCAGIEISKYAVEHKICDCRIYLSDIKDYDYVEILPYELVTCIDILEHVEEEDLNKVLKNIYQLGSQNFLFSIPFEGDPNLYNDKTHKIFKPKDWWICELEKVGFKIEKTPDYFHFKNQMVIARK